MQRYSGTNVWAVIIRCYMSAVTIRPLHVRRPLRCYILLGGYAVTYLSASVMHWSAVTPTHNFRPSYAVTYSSAATGVHFRRSLLHAFTYSHSSVVLIRRCTFIGRCDSPLHFRWLDVPPLRFGLVGRHCTSIYTAYVSVGRYAVVNS